MNNCRPLSECFGWHIQGGKRWHQSLDAPRNALFLKTTLKALPVVLSEVVKHYMWVRWADLRVCLAPVKPSCQTICKSFAAKGLRLKIRSHSTSSTDCHMSPKLSPDVELVKIASKFLAVVENLSET